MVPLRWLQAVGNVLITLLAVTVLYGLWIEPGADWYARLVGVEGVLVAALTLLVPVLSRFTAPVPRDASEDGSPQRSAMVRYCPACGRPVVYRRPGSGLEIVCDGCV